MIFIEIRNTLNDISDRNGHHGKGEHILSGVLASFASADVDTDVDMQIADVGVYIGIEMLIHWC